MKLNRPIASATFALAAPLKRAMTPSLSRGGDGRDSKSELAGHFGGW